MPAGKRRCTPGTVFFNQVNCLNYSFSGSLFFETQENNISIYAYESTRIRKYQGYAEKCFSIKEFAHHLNRPTFA
jgi:hypothetical protein